MFQEIVTVGGEQFSLVTDRILTIEQRNQTIEQITNQLCSSCNKVKKVNEIGGMREVGTIKRLQGTCTAINQRQAGQGIGLWASISGGTPGMSCPAGITVPAYNIWWFKYPPGITPGPFPPTGANLIAYQPGSCPVSGTNYNYGYTIPVADGNTPGNWTYGAYMTDYCLNPGPQVVYSDCTVDVLPAGVTPTPTITPTPSITPTPTITPTPPVQAGFGVVGMVLVAGLAFGVLYAASKGGAAAGAGAGAAKMARARR